MADAHKLPPFGVFTSEIFFQDLNDILKQDFSNNTSLDDQDMFLETVEEVPQYQEPPQYQTLEMNTCGYEIKELYGTPAMMDECDEDDNLSVMLDYDDLSFLDEDTSISGNESDNVSTTGMVIETGLAQNIPRHICFDRPASRNSESSESSATTDDENYEKPYCKSRRGAKNILLWKFLLQQLDTRTDLVTWTSRKNGEFKFIDTAKVSRLWGEQKQKRDMTFEKLSRGIRHYYKSKLMERVGGSRLMYKFNWQKVPRPFRKG